MDLEISLSICEDSLSYYALLLFSAVAKFIPLNGRIIAAIKDANNIVLCMFFMLLYY